MSGRSNALIQIAEKYPCQTYVEVGCRAGNTAVQLHKRFPLIEVILIDINDSTLRKDLLKDVRYKFYHMSSIDASNRILDNSIDLIYIDADHAYKYVLADIKAWLPKVKKGKIICGHDYSKIQHPGVVQAVDERFDADEINLITDTDYNDVYVWWVRA